MKGHIQRISSITQVDTLRRDGLQAVLMAHRGKLVAFFTSRTRDFAEAEDIVQEIFLKLETAAGEPIADPLPYLYRVGLNIVIDRSRERQRRAAREESWSDATVTMIGKEASDHRSSPFADLEAKQRAQAIAAAIAALPPGARRAFTRHKIDGLSHAEVARELGISRSGVEKHIAVAFRHLAGVLAE
jgi:RNA polymerase sigma-70 factor (ECF subfamily)